IGADLHSCLAKPRGFSAQFLLHRGLARDVLSDIALDSFGKERPAHSAKDAMERFAWQPRSGYSSRTVSRELWIPAKRPPGRERSVACPAGFKCELSLTLVRAAVDPHDVINGQHSFPGLVH